MDLHCYNRETGEYTGFVAARANPEWREGDAPSEQFFIPAYATALQPPAVGVKQAAVFAAGAWSLVPDHRGETWWDGDGKSHQISELGDPALDGLTDTEPPPPEPTPTTKQELAGYAAARRFEKEIAGVAWGEFVIQTDRESQAKMLAEFVAIGAGLRADPSPWKFAGNKFATLSNTDMSAVCLAGRDHVAAAFATEDTVQAEITAGTITSITEIDAAFA